jgi:hypothetical protein
MQRFFFLGLDLGDFAAEMRAEHEELVQLLRTGRAPAAAVELPAAPDPASRDRILRALIDERIDIPVE